MKKTVIKVFGVIVGMAAAAGFFSSSFLASAQIAAPASSSGDLVPVYQPLTGATIDMGTDQGTVTVNNFYTTALGAEDEFIVLSQGGNYAIDYDSYNSGFDLDLGQNPSAANRTAAETSFLKLLNVSQSDACKLTVAVSEEDASSTVRTPLSFCQ